MTVLLFTALCAVPTVPSAFRKVGVVLIAFGLLMIYDWIAMPYKTRYYNYIKVMSVLDYDDYEAPGD